MLKGLKMKRIGIVWLIFFACSASAEWIQVAVKSTKDSIFYDPKTIGVYENYRKVWLLFNFAKPLDVGSEQGQSKTYQSTKGPALDEKQALQKLRWFQGVVKTLPMAKTCLLHALAAIFLSCSITGL